MNTTQSRPVAGVLWMVLTGILFVGVTAGVKQTGGRIPAVESAFLRYALGLVFFLPMIRPLMKAGLDKRTFGLLTLRGFVHSFGVVMWFFAMTQITIAEVTAINYLNPVFITLGAVVFFGEKLAARRILAVFAALVGALIILRPGVRELETGHIAMVGTALLFAVSYLIIGRLAGRVSPMVIVAMLSIIVTIVLAPIAAMNWVTPTWTEIGLLFAVAAMATGGHYTMTLAFRAAPLTVTQPVTFLQLVWSVTLGALVYGEGIDVWVIAGGTLILSAVIFITIREAQLKRQITPGPNAAKF